MSQKSLGTIIKLSNYVLKYFLSLIASLVHKCWQLNFVFSHMQLFNLWSNIRSIFFNFNIPFYTVSCCFIGSEKFPIDFFQSMDGARHPFPLSHKQKRFPKFLLIRPWQNVAVSEPTRTYWNLLKPTVEMQINCTLYCSLVPCLLELKNKQEHDSLLDLRYCRALQDRCKRFTFPFCFPEVICEGPHFMSWNVILKIFYYITTFLIKKGNFPLSHLIEMLLNSV